MSRSRKVNTACIAKLKEYFLIKQIKPTPWALSINLSAAVLCRYLAGKTTIGPKNASKIIAATSGYMTLTDFYG